MTFRMFYPKYGPDRKEYTYPVERLWEVVQRADKAFIRPMQPEDHARFQRALEINRGEQK